MAAWSGGDILFFILFLQLFIFTSSYYNQTGDNKFLMTNTVNFLETNQAINHINHQNNLMFMHINHHG